MEVRTKNEIVPPPSSVIEPVIVQGTIQPLGTISAIIECTIVIQSLKGLPAMDEESIICFENGKALGAVAEVFGPIYEPLYILRFPRRALPLCGAAPVPAAC